MRRLAAIAAVVALAATGCASSDRDLARELQAERTETLTIITRAELDAQPNGSPARAVLSLWRAVQFRNAQGALAQVEPQPTRDQLKPFEEFVVGVGAQTAATAKPVVVNATESGNVAKVTVEFVKYRKVGDEVRTEVTGRLEAELRRISGRWLVLWREAADQIPQALA
jgi:hypothetical protein